MKITIFIFLLMTPFGSDYQINTRTSQKQANPAVAMDSNGNSVFVWNSYFESSSRSNDIIGRRLGSDCNFIGDEFRINTVTTGNQAEPSIASDSFGNFIVTWQGPGLVEENRDDIYARRFDVNGIPLGPEWIVNSDVNDIQQHPAIAVGSNGKSIIVWDSNETFRRGDRMICGQLYDSNGLGFGNEFVVDGEISNSRYPDVAMDSNGGFAITWMEEKNTVTSLIKARLYNSDGSARTLPFIVSTIGFSSITEPSIVMDSTGYFVITWDGDPKRAGDDDIHARLYDPNGNALCEQFVVNTLTAGQQQNPQAAMNSIGEFIIVWDSTIDPNKNRRDICGQRFDSLFKPIGSEFLVNTITESDHSNPAIALSDIGSFIAAWQRRDQNNADWDIFGCSGYLKEPSKLKAD